MAEQNQDILSRIKQVVSQQLDVDAATIKEDSAFVEDLGADSLALVEMVMAFEEAFNIEIPEADTSKILTVNDAVAYIQQQVG
jgi:acyl carrier protein